MRSRLTCLVAASALVASCNSSSRGANADTTAAPAVDTAATRAMLDASNRAFAEAMLKGDTAAVVAKYAEDAVSYQSYSEPVVGKANIAKSVRDWFAGMKYSEADAAVDEIYPVGTDMVLELGHYSGKANVLGREMNDHGRYMNLWKRQPDGSWKLFRDISNSSVPLKF
jgi:ketosteroid isomerase-like protein